MRATKVSAGLAESNGKLLLGIWRDSLHVTCGLTACTPGSAPGQTLGNEYGKTLPFYLYVKNIFLALLRAAIAPTWIERLLAATGSEINPTDIPRSSFVSGDHVSRTSTACNSTTVPFGLSPHRQMHRALASSDSS